MRLFFFLLLTYLKIISKQRLNYGSYLFSFKEAVSRSDVLDEIFTIRGLVHGPEGQNCAQHHLRGDQLVKKSWPRGLYPLETCSLA